MNARCLRTLGRGTFQFEFGLLGFATRLDSCNVGTDFDFADDMLHVFPSLGYAMSGKSDHRIFRVRVIYQSCIISIIISLSLSIRDRFL